MQDIVARLGHGEDFAQLAAAASEDEASKNRGGDLGFFGANRVPAEFFAAVENLTVAAPAQFLETHLGFHAVQVTEVHPARPLTLAEATPGINRAIAAEKRLSAVALLQSELAQRARFAPE